MKRIVLLLLTFCAVAGYGQDTTKVKNLVVSSSVKMKTVALDTSHKVAVFDANGKICYNYLTGGSGGTVDITGKVNYTDSLTKYATPKQVSDSMAKWINVTNAQALTLISDKGLKKGSYYKITDACDLGIILSATSDSTLDPKGIGGFYNPDFQDVGNYSAVHALTGRNKGTNRKCWDSIDIEHGSTLHNGDIVFWNGLHYQVISVGDTNATPPNVNTTAYRVLPKSDKMGYIIEWDNVVYDVFHDWIETREDRRGNYISNTYLEDAMNFGYGFSTASLFQWGNDVCTGNKVHGGVIDQLNQRGVMYGNILANDSKIDKNVLRNGNINYNTLGQTTSITGNVVSDNAEISWNHIAPTGYIMYNTLNYSATISGNNISTSCGIGYKLLGHYDTYSINTINYGDTIHETISGIKSFLTITGSQSVKGLITTDSNGTSADWNAKVSFPGFGTGHTTAAYGDHNHTGVYQPAGSYLTVETDPNVSAWAKSATKPAYTYSEVGAAPAGSYLTSSDILNSTGTSTSKAISQNAAKAEIDSTAKSIWVGLSGTRASNTTFTLTGTQLTCDQLTGRLVRCYSSTGTLKKGAILSATVSSGTVTVTVAMDAVLATGDVNFAYTPQYHRREFERRHRVSGELYTDASNAVGTWYNMNSVDTCTMTGVSFYVLTAAAGTGAAAAVNVYFNATNVFSAAIDLATAASSLNNMPNTPTITPGSVLTIRVTNSAGATNKASDLEVVYNLIPNRLYYQ